MLSLILLETLIAIHEFEIHWEIAPSIPDLEKKLERGHGTVQSRLNRLIGSGHIVRQENRNRSCKITPLGIVALKAAGKYQSKPNLSNQIPCLGEIAAGYLSEPATNEEFIEMENLDPEKNFLLRVSGDSMKDIGILDRSIVSLERVPDGYEPKSGEVAAVYVEGRGVTLKRYYRKGKNISLEAANPDYLPQIIDPKQTLVQIYGIWTGWTKINLM